MGAPGSIQTFGSRAKFPPIRSGVPGQELVVTPRARMRPIRQGARRSSPFRLLSIHREMERWKKRAVPYFSRKASANAFCTLAGVVPAARQASGQVAGVAG